MTAGAHLKMSLSTALALLLATAWLGACSETELRPGVPLPDDDDVVSDDDDATTDDDDDSVGDDDDATDYNIGEVTFAATLDGTALQLPDPLGPVTELEGTFHFVYWTDLGSQRLACRQRFSFVATGAFGAAQTDPCEGCRGTISIGDVQPIDPALNEDSCQGLPDELDLSFLLDQKEPTLAADFATLSLVSMDELLETGWPIATAGLGAEELVERYELAGLDVEFVAFVSPTGWLADEAGLGSVGSAWGEQGVLPMLVIYRDPDDEGWGPSMVGPTYISSLWSVRLGGDDTADIVP